MKAMEYRGVQYTLIVDEQGDWQWAVSMGNPKKIKSGQAATKGTAILKVWAVIDRASASIQPKGRGNGSRQIIFRMCLYATTRLQTSATRADGEQVVVPTPRRWCQAGGKQNFPLATVARKPGHRGELCVISR